MKRIILLLLLTVVVSTSVYAGKKKDFVEYNYELEMDPENMSATSGYRIFKVWSYCKKRASLTQEICMRNAVHGILFKGLVALDSGTQGSLPALVPEGYNAHKEYFDKFFESGAFKQFIQKTSKGAQQAGDIIKTRNNEWKVGMSVQVNVNALRNRLQQDGIVKSVKDIFSK